MNSNVISICPFPPLPTFPSTLPHSWLCLQPWARPHTSHLNPNTRHWPLPPPSPSHLCMSTEPCCTAFIIPFEACWTSPRPRPHHMSSTQRGLWCGLKVDCRGLIKVNTRKIHSPREACLDDMTPASQPTVECKSNASVACLCTQRVRCLPGKEENTNIYYIYCMDIWKNNALLDKQICSFCLE